MLAIKTPVPLELNLQTLITHMKFLSMCITEGLKRAIPDPQKQLEFIADHIAKPEVKTPIVPVQSIKQEHVQHTAGTPIYLPTEVKDMSEPNDLEYGVYVNTGRLKFLVNVNQNAFAEDLLTNIADKLNITRDLIIIPYEEKLTVKDFLTIPKTFYDKQLFTIKPHLQLLNYFTLQLQVYSYAVEGDGNIPLIVRMLTGKILCVMVYLDNTVAALKSQIEAISGIPINQCRLIYAGRSMADNKRLDFYNIHAYSTLVLILNLRGGMYHYTSGRDGPHQLRTLSHKATEVCQSMWNINCFDVISLTGTDLLDWLGVSIYTLTNFTSHIINNEVETDKDCANNIVNLTKKLMSNIFDDYTTVITVTKQSIFYD